MKYFVFYLIFFTATNLYAQTQLLSDFNTTMQNFDKFEDEKQLLQRLQKKTNINQKYIEQHIEKLSKLEDLIKENKLKNNIINLAYLTKKFQWKKTIVKVKNIQNLCEIELQKPEECLSLLEDLRAFIESQDLNLEKQEHFLNLLDSTEELAIEYALLFKEFKLYFNEEVDLINSELNKISASNKNSPSSQQANNFIVYLLYLLIIPVSWLMTNQYPKILFLFKSKKWFNKLKKETTIDLNLISKNLHSIYPLINIIENEFKNAQISIISNEFFTTLKIQIPSKDSFYYDLDNKKYNNLRKCILDLQNKVNSKDRIHLSDVYDPKGNINNQFIKINLAKI